MSGADNVLRKMFPPSYVADLANGRLTRYPCPLCGKAMAHHYHGTEFQRQFVPCSEKEPW